LLNVPIADGVSGTEHPVALAVGPRVWELLAQLRIDTTGGLLCARLKTDAAILWPKESSKLSKFL